jgi:hypothetical protein
MITTLGNVRAVSSIASPPGASSRAEPLFRRREGSRADRNRPALTPEMAARLARYFGTSEQFWLNLQDAFAVHQVKKKYSKELKAIKPLAAGASR